MQSGTFQTTATSPDEAFSKQFTLDQDGQNYRIIVSGEFTVNNKNDKAHLEVLLDSSEVAVDSFKPSDNNDAHSFTRTLFVTLDSGLHEIAVNFYSDGGSTVTARRFILTVDKR